MTQAAFKLDQIALDLQGLVAGTRILTADGALPVEYLGPGDRIVTRSGLRVLQAVTVQRVRRAAMVRIGHDTLGVGRPEADVLVAAGQNVLIRDWRAQAMYGCAQAMIPAARLVDGQLIRAEALSDVRLFGLQFDGPEVIYAGGLELGCVPQVVAA